MMCEECDQEIIEEYRRLVKDLFGIVQERLYHCEQALFDYRLRQRRREQEEQIQSMKEALRKEK